MSRRLLSIAVVVCVFLTACTSPSERIDEEVSAALHSQEGHSSAVVDFSEIVQGDWTELVIVCRGASTADVNAALGFDWAGSPDPSSRSFLAMMIFTTGSSVESYFSAGHRAFNEQPYFTPCDTMRPGEGGPDIPVVISRENSELAFSFIGNDPGHPSDYWYIPTIELESRRSA